MPVDIGWSGSRSRALNDAEHERRARAQEAKRQEREAYQQQRNELKRQEQERIRAEKERKRLEEKAAAEKRQAEADLERQRGIDVAWSTATHNPEVQEREKQKNQRLRAEQEAAREQELAKKAQNDAERERKRAVLAAIAGIDARIAQLEKDYGRGFLEEERKQIRQQINQLQSERAQLMAQTGVAPLVGHAPRVGMEY